MKLRIVKDGATWLVLCGDIKLQRTYIYEKALGTVRNLLAVDRLMGAELNALTEQGLNEAHKFEL